MWNETVKLATPYQFQQVMSRLAINQLHIVNIEEKIVKLPLMLGREQIVVTVQEIGTFEEPEFLITAESNDKEEVLSRVSAIFGWHTPLADIKQHLACTSLRPLVERFAYIPLVLEFDLFECLTRCIIHQQVNLKFAFTLTERFVKTYGTEKAGVWFHPSPERVAQIPIEELRILQLSQRKSEYIVGLAESIVNGTLQLETFPQLTNEEIAKQLLPLRGIGQWTVQNFLMFGLGRPDLFPKADIGIQRAVQRLFYLDAKPDDTFLETIKKEYMPYGSYAALYLWRSIE